MAGIQRFFTYIYAYENNDKNQNVGFAKVDIRGDYCQIEIHLKRTGYTNMKCPVYLFNRTDKEIIGVEIGQITLNNGVGDFGRRLSCNQIGDSSYCIQEMKGIIIFLTETVMFASQWDEKEIQRADFKEYDKSMQVNGETEKETEKETAAKNPLENVTSENTDIEKLEGEPEVREQIRDIPEDQDNRDEPESWKNPETQTEENFQETGQNIEQEIKQEIEQETNVQENRNIKAQEWKENWQIPWDKLVNLHGEVKPFEKNPDISCIKIELKDLKDLPKQYWYLGSNSFLLHGFFNYRYLILGKIPEEDRVKWFVGVPGVFQNQERILAGIFGFPEFKQEKNTEAKTNQFGYWYRIME